MNTYVFEVEYIDGYIDTFEIVSPTRTMAMEMLFNEWFPDFGICTEEIADIAIDVKEG